MQVWLSISIIFLALHIIQVKSNDPWWITSKAVTLTQIDFADKVGKDIHYVVEFYSKQCFWCENLSYEYDKLSEYYNFGTGPRNDIRIAKVDSPDNMALAYRYRIMQYPTILLIKKGNLEEAWYFPFERTFERMKEWIENIVGPEEKPQLVNDHNNNGTNDESSSSQKNFLQSDSTDQSDPGNLPSDKYDKADSLTPIDHNKNYEDIGEPKQSSLNDCSEDSLQKVYDQVLFAKSQANTHDEDLLNIKNRLLESLNGTSGWNIIRDLLFFSFGVMIGIGVYIAHKKITAVNHLYKDQSWEGTSQSTPFSFAFFFESFKLIIPLISLCMILNRCKFGLY